MVTLLHHYYPTRGTCEQYSEDFGTTDWSLVNKRVETCGQESGDLWPLDQRLVDKRSENCGQVSEDI